MNASGAAVLNFTGITVGAATGSFLNLAAGTGSFAQLNAPGASLTNLSGASLSYSSISSISGAFTQLYATGASLNNVSGTFLSYATVSAGSGTVGSLSGTSANYVAVVGGTGSFTNLSAATGVFGSVSIGTGTFGNLVVGTGSFGNLIAATGSFSNIVVGTGTFGNLTAATGSFSNLVVGTGSFGNLVVGAGTFSNIVVGTGSFGNLIAATGSFSNLTAATGTFGNLVVGTGTFGNLTAATGTFGNLTAATGTFGNLTAASGAFTQLNATGASLASLTGASLSYISIQAGTGTFMNLSSASGTFTQATINTLTASTGIFLNLSATAASITSTTGTNLSYTTGSFINLNATQLSATGGAVASLTGMSLGYASVQGGTGLFTNLNSLQGSITSISGTNLSYTAISSSTGSFNGLIATGAGISTLTGANLSYITTSNGTGTYVSLMAGTGSFTQLSATGANVLNLTGTSLNYVTGSLNNLYTGTGTFGGLYSGTGSFTQLNATAAGLTNLTGTSLNYTQGTIANISGTSLSYLNLTSMSGAFGKLSATGAGIATLTGASLSYATSTYVSLTAATGTFTALTAASGSFSSLIAGPSPAYFGGSLTVGQSNTLGVGTDDGNAYWSVVRSGVGPAGQAMSMSTGGVVNVGYVPLVYNYGVSSMNNAYQSALIVTDALVKGSTGLFYGQSQNFTRIYSDGALGVNGPLALGTTPIGSNIGVTGSMIPIMTKLYGSATVARSITFPDASGTVVVSGAGGGVQLSAPLSIRSTGGSTVLSVADSATANTGTLVRTYNNTLDDGNGNMVVTATGTFGQLRVTGSSLMSGTLTVLSSTGIALGSVMTAFIGSDSFGGLGITNTSSINALELTPAVVQAGFYFSDSVVGDAVLRLNNSTGTMRLGTIGGTGSSLRLGATTVRTLNSTLDDGSGNAALLNTTTGSALGALSVLAPNLAIGNYTQINLGQSLATNNSASIHYFYSASGSASNTIGMGFSDTGKSITVNAAGAVSSQNNVLDDAMGNLSAAGYVSSSVATSSASPHLWFRSLLSTDSQVGNNVGVYAGPSASVGLNAGSGGVYTLKLGTKNNVLDDGSGNVNVAGYLVARGPLSFPTQLAVGLGTDSGNARGYVQASNGVNTVAPLILNPNGGKLSSQNNTLDDGKGNLIVAATGSFTNLQTGSLNVSGSGNVASNLFANSMQTYSIGAPGTAGLTFAYAGQNDAALYAVTYIRLHGDSTQGQATNQLVVGGGQVKCNVPLLTQFNTLDNGAGSATIAAALNINQSGTGITGTQLICAPSTGSFFTNVVAGDSIMRNQTNTNVRLGFVGASGTQAASLNLGYPYAVTTKNNTVDDGNGNMVVPATGTFGQLRVTGNATVSGTLTVTSSSGISVNAGGTPFAIASDSFGGLNVTNTTSSSGLELTPAVPQTGFYFSDSLVGDAVFRLNNSTGTMRLGTIGGTGSSLRLGATTVRTLNNGLDDGSGNCTIIGNVTSASSGSSTVSSYTPAGSVQFKPSTNTSFFSGIGYNSNGYGNTGSNGSSLRFNNYQSGLGGMPWTFACDQNGPWTSGLILTASSRLNTLGSASPYANASGYTLYNEGATWLNNSLRTAASVLDDSLGNLSAGGAVVARGGLLTSVSAGTAQLAVQVGGLASITGAFVQGFGSGATSNIPLNLNASGGPVYTAHSVLDDGSGNMALNVTSASSTAFSIVQPNLTAGSAMAVRFGPNLSSSNDSVKLFFNWAGTGSSSNNLQFGFGANGFSQFRIYASNAVTTQNNTLDDGSGNATLVSSSQSYSTSTGNAGSTLPTFTTSNRITVGIGGGGSNITGVIQTSSSGTVSALPIAIQGSKLVTWNSSGSLVNTLDDGNGNFACAGSVNAGNGHFVTGGPSVSDGYVPSGTVFYWRNTSSANNISSFTQLMTLSSASVLTVGSTTYTSDRRLKFDVAETTDDQAERVLRLKPVTFRKHASPDQLEHGFIAQDVRAVFSELVTEAEGDDRHLSVNYVGLLAPMVRKIQRQEARLVELESRLAHYERVLDRLAHRVDLY